MEETSCSTSRVVISLTFPEQRKMLLLPFGLQVAHMVEAKAAAADTGDPDFIPSSATVL